MFCYIYRLMTIAIKICIHPRKLSVHETSVISWRVWPWDIDINFHLNNGAMLTILDFGRFDYIARIGLLKLILFEKWKPVIGNSLIKFRKSVPLFAKFEIHTRVVCWDEKYVYFEQKVLHQKKVTGILYAAGLFRKQGLNVSPFEIIEKMGADVKTPPMPEIINLWQMASSGIAK